MTDAHPISDEAAAVALAARVIDPFRWKKGQGGGPMLSAAEVEHQLLDACGLGAIAQRIWQESRAVSAAAGRRVGRLTRERYGIRSPKGGLSGILVFLLTLGMTAPLIFLGIGYRGNSLEPRPDAGAMWTAIIGGAMLAIALATLGRPVPRSTSFQSQAVCVALGGLATLWAITTDQPTVRLGLVIGIAGLVLAVALFWFGRHRDPAATAKLDSAVDVARAEVTSEVAAERERLVAELTAELAAALPRRDLEVLRRARTLAIETLRAEGNRAEDLAPDSAPGAYIIEERTNDWMPRAGTQRVTAKRARREG